MSEERAGVIATGAGAQSPTRIRRGDVGDAAALAEFGARVFAATFGPENDPRDMEAYLAATYGEARQRAELERTENAFLIAEHGGELAGYAFVRDARLDVDAFEDESRSVELVRFYVDPRWHGQGIARSLMDAVAAEVRARGAVLLWLGVWERNPRAIRFYEKQGFRDVGHHDFVLGSDVQRDRLMVRELGATMEAGRE